MSTFSREDMFQDIHPEDLRRDFLEFLQRLQDSEQYKVEINSPMGELWDDMISYPDYEIKRLMKKHFPEEII